MVVALFEMVCVLSSAFRVCNATSWALLGNKRQKYKSRWGTMSVPHTALQAVLMRQGFALWLGQTPIMSVWWSQSVVAGKSDARCTLTLPFCCCSERLCRWVSSVGKKQHMLTAVAALTHCGPDPTTSSLYLVALRPVCSSCICSSLGLQSWLGDSFNWNVLGLGHKMLESPDLVWHCCFHCSYIIHFLLWEHWSSVVRPLPVRLRSGEATHTGQCCSSFCVQRMGYICILNVIDKHCLGPT